MNEFHFLSLYYLFCSGWNSTIFWRLITFRKISSTGFISFGSSLRNSCIASSLFSLPILYARMMSLWLFIVILCPSLLTCLKHNETRFYILIKHYFVDKNPLIQAPSVPRAGVAWIEKMWIFWKVAYLFTIKTTFYQIALVFCQSNPTFLYLIR